MFDLLDHTRSTFDPETNRRADEIALDAEKAKNTRYGASESKVRIREEKARTKARYDEDVAEYHSKGLELPEDKKLGYARAFESLDAQGADADTHNANAVDTTRSTGKLAESVRALMSSAANFSTYRPASKPRRNESTGEYVERLRSDQSTNRAQHKDKSGSWILRKDAKAKAEARIKDEYFGKPVIDVRVTREGAFPRIPLVAVAAEPRGGTLPVAPDLTGAYVRHNWDEIAAEIDRQIDAAYDEANPLELSPDEKAKALAKLDAELLELEHMECEAIWSARSRGEHIAFRADTNPRAILGVR